MTAPMRMKVLETTRNYWQRATILAMAGVLGAAAVAQAPHAMGTVKATSGNTVTMTTSEGQDYTVTVPDAAKILDVAPGSHDLKSATPGQVGDIAVGDKLIVNGSAGDTGTTLTAQRIILMKSAAIAQSHEQEEAAWAHGSGGIVKTVNAGAGTIVLSSGLKTITVQVSQATIVRHYAGDSIRFEDAVGSSLAAIQPGDQLRVRGTKSDDGLSIQADEIVAGTFRNFSGTVSSIDGTAGTITLKDLTTKKNVTVTVTANSDVRRLPPQMAAAMAGRMHGTAAGANGGGGAPHAAAPAAASAGDSDQHRAAGRAGMDLSQMLSRLPTETLGGLKVGEAVMIVATSSGAASNKETAITLLAGVEPILAAPAGESMTLSPWSVGGSAPDGGGGQQ
jgi:hypothetical protein